MAKIGYARVSTEDQNLDLQRIALEDAGCSRIFEDHGISALAKTRPGFESALQTLQPEDQFIIWKMDRAFRSLRHALDTLEELERRKIEFRSLTDQINTTTPMGKCMYQIRNAFAELERNLISERTKAGMEAARKRGVILGRPRKLSHAQVLKAKMLLARRPDKLNTIAAALNVCPKTITRAINRYDAG